MLVWIAFLELSDVPRGLRPFSKALVAISTAKIILNFTTKEKTKTLFLKEELIFLTSKNKKNDRRKIE